MVYLAEPGDGGKGIRVAKGDRFRIPAGWLRLSLDPSQSRGAFTKPGVSWFVQQILVGGLPQDEGGIDAYLEQVDGRVDQLLRKSPMLDGLDLDNESDAQEAVRRIEESGFTDEWWAMVVGATAAAVADDLDGESSRTALLNAIRMQSFLAMLAYREHLADLVWTGYQHTTLVYDIAAAGARTPEDVEKIRALRPLFSRLDEDVLHAWVNSDVEIGPRIGVTNMEEPLLRSLAAYHLSLFERDRAKSQTENAAADERMSAWRSPAVWVGAAVALIVAIIAAIWGS